MKSSAILRFTLNPEVIIVGAGIAGLSCARALAERGVAVRVLEKSRGVGGRCATRRLEGQPVDHGPAFLHGSDPEFVAALRASAQGGEMRWPEHTQGRGNPCQPGAFRPNEFRLAPRDGVNAFAKTLARGLDVVRRVSVRSLERRGGRIRLGVGEGPAHEAADVVLTPPAPQSLDLLDTVDDPDRVLEVPRHLLREVSTLRCLTLLAVYPAREELPSWQMAYPEESRILHLISVDSAKRDDPAWTILVLQALPCWSRVQWDSPVAAWSEAMLAEAATYVGSWVTRPEWSHEHRWRHARLGGGELTSPLLLAWPGGTRLGLAGEAFEGGGGVQGAWRSGRRLAARLIGEPRAAGNDRDQETTET